MRLLHSATLTFQDFVSADVPRYAILSHTWSSETTYQDFLSNEWQRGDGQVNRPLSQGIDKVLSFAETARKEGFTWIWIDTCCIDKTSSAELSESINSMFQWYQRAAVCYVHLSDLDLDSETPSLTQLPKCRWFTRCWTLQELLAPTDVRFYDARWRFMNSEEDIRLEVCKITGITVSALSYQTVQTRARRPLSYYTIAEKMRWAAYRQATRTEDIAYCLLGIFNINMSLRYGEGANAFIRLQRKIMKMTSDETLFAWAWTPEIRRPETPRAHVSLTLGGLLAPHPRSFKDFPRTVVSPSTRRLVTPPINSTPRGLEFTIFGDMERDHQGFWTDVSFPLNCFTRGRRSDYIIITLTKASGAWYRNISYGVNVLPCDDSTADSDRVVVSFRDDQRLTKFYVAADSAPFKIYSWGDQNIIGRPSEVLSSPSNPTDGSYDSQLAIFRRAMLVRFFGQEMDAASWSRTLAWDQLEYFVEQRTLHRLHSLLTIYKVARIAQRVYPQQVYSEQVDPIYDARAIIDSSEREHAKKFAKYYDRDRGSTLLGLVLFMRTLYYKDAWAGESRRPRVADRVAGRLVARLRSRHTDGDKREKIPRGKDQEENLSEESPKTELTIK